MLPDATPSVCMGRVQAILITNAHATWVGVARIAQWIVTATFIAVVLQAGVTAVTMALKESTVRSAWLDSMEILFKPKVQLFSYILFKFFSSL